MPDTAGGGWLAAIRHWFKRPLGGRMGGLAVRDHNRVPARMASSSRSKDLTVGAIILAGGAGRRMGGRPKPLLERDGEPLLLRQVRLAAEAGIGPVIVVLAHHSERVVAMLERARSLARPPPGVAELRWVIDPAPVVTPASCLRCGLTELPTNLSAWLLMFSDQPLLEVGDVHAVLHAWATRAKGIELVVPRCGRQRGNPHPIAFGAALRAAVMQTPNGDGEREWRRAHPERIAFLPVAHTRYITDVDTLVDLDRMRINHGVDLTWPRAWPGQSPG